MPFPVVNGTAFSTTGVTSSVDSIITLPTNVAGDLMIAFCAKDSAATTSTWPAGWTELVDTGSTGFVYTIGYKISTGGEASVTVTSLVTERSSSIAIVISAGTHDGTAPQIATQATGSSTTPDPPALTPTGGAQDWMFIAIAVADDSASPFPITVWPTNYGSNQLSCSHAANGVASSAAIAICTRALNATTDNPSTFTMTVTETWAATTMAVRGARVPWTSPYPPFLAQ